MVLNAAVQMLREADELKQKLSKFKSGTSMLQDRSLWSTQQQLQKIYQKVLVLDLDYALDKKVEQDLWNIGFKQQIEALQAISKDRKNPLRSEGQAMLSWVLQAAAGFYLCLLHQICTTFKLDLPFRRRSSLLGWVESWGAAPGLGPGMGPAVGPGVGPDVGPGLGQDADRQPPPAAARYACQHVLVHLGDLARYRHQLRVAYTFYRHALVVSAHSGQPYNQLALVSWRRGRRLGAVYWHVRSLMVRAPFPPAPANLARTLTAAQPLREHKDLPVLPGLGAARTATPAVTQTLPLDAHSYVTELIQALHLIHNLEELDRAAALVNTLNSSLSALVATDSFEAMTLIKMACVVIWLVHSSTEDLRLAGQALSEPEARAAGLAHALASGALLALLLPNYTLPQPLQRPLPAVKVWLQWTLAHEASVEAWEARPALWPALAHTLTMLAHTTPLQHPASYATVPLAEDAELQGFVPLEEALADLNFAGQAAWDSTGPPQSPSDMSAACLSAEPELERRVRAHRLVQLGRRLAQRHKDHLSYTEDEGGVTFTAAAAGGEQLSNALAELRRAGGAGGAGDTPGGSPGGAAGDVERDDTSDDERASPPPPVVISEADFREKVREKRIGILKPQGSLERAREERALALTQEDTEPEGSEEGKGEDKREPRRARVNIAMAAIMRKQEETNKQVKFVTPPPTPESTPDVTEQKEDRPKVIQPKAIKSLANLPVGKKIGGILSLKDKSGYPHLVNIEEPKKVEKEEKKASQPTHMSQNSQTYLQKRHELPPSPNWTNNPPAPFNEAPRMTFQKNYGIQNTGISYNPTYQPSVNNQGIRLPVVNPKEIDVRTAALQKQSSRQDLFQDGPKFPHGYQISGDKKNFLNDLPPRFANQYRYWQTAQENQFNDNKFRDDKSNSLFDNQARSSWSTTDQQYPQQQMPWWKPENPPNFNANYNPMNIQPNYFANVANPYQNAQPYPMQGQSKPESLVNQNYMQSTIGQPQMPNVQNLVSPNYNPMNNFSYPPAVGYDSAMYPQFNKLGYQPMQMKTDLSGLNFGLEQRNAGFPEHGPDGQMKPLEHMTQGGEGSSSEAGNTYSLFSGAPDTAAWGAPRAPHQSLWSGPGPSPLERLLEQQKQMKPPAPH